MECLAYGLEHPGADMYLFRETYDDLEANLIREWKEKVPRQLYKYNEGKHIATLLNGTTVKFRFIKNLEDANRYQGRSMDWIGVDELTNFLEEWVTTLLSCLRSSKGFPPRFMATCNPGGKMYNLPHRLEIVGFIIPEKIWKAEKLIRGEGLM